MLLFEPSAKLGVEIDHRAGRYPAYAGGAFEGFSGNIRILELNEQIKAAVHCHELVKIVLAERTINCGREIVLPLWNGSDQAWAIGARISFEFSLSQRHECV